MHNFEKLSSKNLLTSSDLTREEIIKIFDLASKFKNNGLKYDLKGKVLGLIFDKASTRTRVSFQVAMSKLGGTTIDLNPSTSQIGRGEPIKDTARVLSCYCDAIAIRTFKQTNLEEYAKWSTKPIINALTDLEHPCQALADYYTVQETFGNFKNLTLTFIGDGNNVANSLIICGSILGAKINIVCPKGFEPPKEIIEVAKNKSDYNSEILVTNNLDEGVKGSNVLYTDVWSSMGQESNKSLKEERFEGYTLNKDMISKADNDVIIMHCLPAYRGKEISNDVFESSRSRIFNQAENRLHAQQALLTKLTK